MKYFLMELWGQDTATGQRVVKQQRVIPALNKDAACETFFSNADIRSYLSDRENFLSARLGVMELKAFNDSL